MPFQKATDFGGWEDRHARGWERKANKIMIESSFNRGELGDAKNRGGDSPQEGTKAGGGWAGGGLFRVGGEFYEKISLLLSQDKRFIPPQKD